MNATTYTDADGYYPTNEDWAAYAEAMATETAKRGTTRTTRTATEFSIVHTDKLTKGRTSVSVERFKVNGQYRIIYRGAMAMGFCEPLGMYVDRDQAIEQAKAFAVKQGW